MKQKPKVATAPTDSSSQRLAWEQRCSGLPKGLSFATGLVAKTVAAAAAAPAQDPLLLILHGSLEAGSYKVLPQHQVLLGL